MTSAAHSLRARPHTARPAGTVFVRWRTATAVPGVPEAAGGSGSFRFATGSREMLRRQRYSASAVQRFQAADPPRRRRWKRSLRVESDGDQHPCGNSGFAYRRLRITSAAVSMSIPCIATVQGASADVQGIGRGIAARSTGRPELPRRRAREKPTMVRPMMSFEFASLRPG